MPLARWLAVLMLSVCLGCVAQQQPLPEALLEVAVAGGVGDEPGPEAGRPVAFPEGGMVIVVNPVVDPAGTAPIAVPRNADRAEIGITLGAQGTRTDATGLAVLDNLPVGTSVVQFPLVRFPSPGSPAGTVNVSIDQVGLVDAVVLYDPYFGPDLLLDLQYPRSGPRVIQLAKGIYEGPLELSVDGTVLYGEVDQYGRLASVIDGHLVISGNGVRVRNLVVTGGVTILGVGDSVAFSELRTAVIRGPDTLLLRSVLHAPPAVTAPNVLLLDTAVP
jgi:hypothetical protein